MTNTESTRLIRLPGPRLDGDMRQRVLPLLNDAWNTGAQSVILDFSDVELIDSLGVSILVTFHRRRPEGARVVCCALSDYVRDVFEIVQLFRLFDVYESANAAKQALGAE
jgi:anti-anti-sigma factor